MKILIDINHPAHVHYFKNFIEIMKKRGHEFLIISRNKEIEQYLLKKYGFDYLDRGKGSSGKIGRVIYFIKAIFFIFKNAKLFCPDIIISFGTPYPAITGWLLKIPHISFNDTENAKLHHLLTDPFSKYIITPGCYTKSLGLKHIRFNSYMELCYLHPNYFKPDDSIYDLLKLEKNEKYVILRFVSWKAVHDIGHFGLSLENKKKAVKEFSKFARVFISSENELPEELKKYQINIPPEKMHDVLFYAIFLFGESATMASECAVLGTPAIFLDNNGRGYTDEEEQKYGLVFNYSESKEDQRNSIEKGINILKTSDKKSEWQKKRQQLLKDKIDATEFMVMFIENLQKSY